MTATNWHGPTANDTSSSPRTSSGALAEPAGHPHGGPTAWATLRVSGQDVGTATWEPSYPAASSVREGRWVRLAGHGRDV